MSCCPIQQSFEYGVVKTNTSTELDPEQQAEKCSLKESSKCPELRERFLNINGGIEDTITQLTRLISSTEFRKEEGEKIMKAELSYHQGVTNSENEKLARATSRLRAIREDKRVKGALLTKVKGEYDSEVEKCDTMLKELKTEECALDKIRGELLNMDALPNNVTDCLTSAWELEECSLTCGGGKQVLRRTVEIEPNLGYHCPALVAQQSCNEARCPLDCKLEDWTGWSACSAMCDSGVMDRIRPVERQPTAGGVPCGETDDEQACNVQACDKNCVLEDWTEWTQSCTKVCGGGRQVRYKHIKEHEYGELGTCPAFHDAERFQWKFCNMHPCKYDDRYPLVCEAPLDVIVALDGSGSLGGAGFEAVKRAAAEFAGAMGAGIKMGALVFSSPASMEETKVCMGWDPKSKWPQPSKCGIRWAHHMTTDTAAVKTAIMNLESDKRGTLMNIGIDNADVEFGNHGRQYAQSILVIFTDGYPESKDRALESARKYEKTGRLLIAPVGPFGHDEFFQNLVSYPAADNLVSIDSFKKLIARESLVRLLTDFCPNIVQNIPQQEEW